jgi:hypothetical protein
VLGKVGSKAIDQLTPIPTPDVSKDVKEAIKQTASFMEGSLKKRNRQNR